MEKPARNPSDVINAVLEHVPLELAVLRAKLTTIRDDAEFLPPEYKLPAWLRLRDALESSLNNPPQLDWEWKVSDIVENRVPLEMKSCKKTS
jgi:hypothetical protein